MVARMMASRETMTVRNPNGYGSNGSRPFMSPVFQIIHPVNQIPFKIKNHMLPSACVMKSAVRWEKVRRASDFAFMLRMMWREEERKELGVRS